MEGNAMVLVIFEHTSDVRSMVINHLPGVEWHLGGS